MFKGAFKPPETITKSFLKKEKKITAGRIGVLPAYDVDRIDKRNNSFEIEKEHKVARREEIEKVIYLGAAAAAGVAPVCEHICKRF